MSELMACEIFHVPIWFETMKLSIPNLVSLSLRSRRGTLSNRILFHNMTILQFLDASPV
jgi:hypothetical protein